jgi:hypothetical protein
MLPLSNELSVLKANAWGVELHSRGWKKQAPKQYQFACGIFYEREVKPSEVFVGVEDSFQRGPGEVMKPIALLLV